MPRNTLVLLLGLTGVGKTTLLEQATEQTSTHVERLSYGSLLLQEAQNRGLAQNRDELTKLPPDDYDDLQSYTAHHINDIISTPYTDESGEAADCIYVIDTHATLHTPFGYRPGFSDSDVETMNPDQIVFVDAAAKTIRERRDADETRDRDMLTAQELAEQQKIAKQMCSAFAVASRAPLAILSNPPEPDADTLTAARDLANLFDR